MEASAVAVEARVQHDHWWFRGRRRILSRFLAATGRSLPPGARLLDIGCGTGANAAVLRGPGRTVVGIDAARPSLALARSLGCHDAWLAGDATRLPFADGSFDVVVALDVLEHLDDDAAGAREMHRVLRPGGSAIVFVPALPALWGLQDEVSHHRRRYTRRTLRPLIEAAGFRVHHETYFNTLLLPPIFLARRLMRLWRPRSLASENQLGGRLTNALLSALFALESPLLPSPGFPLGVTLALIGHRGQDPGS